MSSNFTFNLKLLESLFPDLSIRQDSSALGATSATSALYSYIISRNYPAKLRVLEAGSGCGILSIMLALANPDWDISGIEIQPQLHALAEANAAALKLKINFSEADLRAYKCEQPYDLIVSNPPWQKLGSGLISPNAERAICRSEMLCTMQDIFALCHRTLTQSKEAILLYPHTRQTELQTLAEASGMKILAISPADSNCNVFHLHSSQTQKTSFQ